MSQETVVSRLSASDYSEILGLLCPYCRIGLPSSLDPSKPNWIHTIPDTEDRFECRAYAIRSLRNIILSVDDSIPLEELDMPLSLPVIDRLKAVNILTAGDVRKSADSELLGVHGINPKRLEKLRCVLNKRMVAIDDFR